MSFLEFITLQANWPVLVAVTIIGFFLVIEVLALLVGLSFHGLFDDLFDLPDTDADLDVDHDVGPADSFLSLLGMGRVPLLVWLISFLAMLSAAVLSVNWMVWNVGLTPMLWLALIIGIPAALLLNRVVSGVLARILPKETTTAVSLDSLVSQRGQIMVGTATNARAAECKVYDRYGKAHSVFARSIDDTSIPQSSYVILVGRDGDGVFQAVKVDG